MDDQEIKGLSRTNVTVPGRLCREAHRKVKAHDPALYRAICEGHGNGTAGLVRYLMNRGLESLRTG